MNKKIKRKLKLVLYIAAISVLSVALVHKVGTLFTLFDKQDIEYSKNVGEKVVINSDTLEVVNYSVLNESYTLSDGQVISSKYLELKKL